MPKPQPKAQSRPPRLAADTWILVAIALAAIAVYAQVLRFDFVNFDDPDYVTRNRHILGGLTPGAVGWAFTSGYGANWFPLTWISYMAVVQLFGVSAGWQHFTNILLHALASALLFAFLDRATHARWRSAFVAAVFALHPLHVESVAWIAERKDVLNAVFWFLTLWAYVRYVEKSTPTRYLAVTFSFVFGLMSKPMIVTLPFLLLLLDVWPLRRTVRWGLRIREKIPLLVLSAAAAVITYEVQSAAGAVEAVTALPAGLRLENAIVSYGWYLAKTVWPSGLAVFYPFPAAIPVSQVAVAAAILAAVTLLVLRCAKTQPHLTVGWLWFLGTLVPVIGLIQVGMQARADRYMYVPMTGLAIMAAWSVPRIKPVAWAAAAVCVACGVLTAAQLEYWQNSETLFRRDLAVTTGNGLAEHNLGAALMEDPTKLREAIEHLQAANRLRPDSERVESDLGTALAKSGQLPEAEQAFRSALRINPSAAILHNNLANVLASEGRVTDAVAEYREALRLDPEYAEARRNLEASGTNLAGAHYNAGIDFANQGRAQDAVHEFEECLRIDPANAEAHNNLGVVLSQMPGRLSDAISHFEAAVRLKPGYRDAAFNLQTARVEWNEGRR